MDGQHETRGELDRRALLKRGALLGGAALWVAPVVQVVGMGRASATEPSVPPPPPPPPVATYPSNVQIIVRKNGVDYGVKYDENDTNPWDWAPQATNENGSCLYKNGHTWVSDHSIADVFNAQAVVTKVDDGFGNGAYRITLPAGFTYVVGYAKCGQNCPAGVLFNGTTYDFDCV